MKYESVQQAREALKKLEQTQAAYNHALGVLYLDAATAAPSDTWEGRGTSFFPIWKPTPMSWMPRQSGR